MKDIFNLSDDNLSFLNPKSKSSDDNLYKVDLKNAQDPKKGYRSIIRFLPYFTPEGRLAETSAIEKHLHYYKSQDNPELQGYYECGKNFPHINNGKCTMCDTFFELDKSNDPSKKERAKNIARTTRYYSYVLILEDEQQPELVGKIMVYSYGFKIKEKIRIQATGEVTGKKCNPFDLAAGKDFYLVVKKIGDFPNYDTSEFDNTPSPLKLNGKPLPTEVTENGKIVIAQAYQEKLLKFLLDRPVELNVYEPKPVTEEIYSKIENIVDIVKGVDTFKAKYHTEKASYPSNDMDDVPFSVKPSENKSKKTTIDSFFDDEE